MTKASMTRWQRDYVTALKVLSWGAVLIISALVVVLPHDIPWVWL